MNKKGFTLIELLAVIVVLAVIMSIAGTSVLNQKKKANIEEAKKIEQTLADLGPGIYSYETIAGVKDYESYCSKKGYVFKLEQDVCKDTSNNTVEDKSSDYFYKKYNECGVDSVLKISLKELAEAGYLKSAIISNPAGGDPCTGYLEVKKTIDGPKFNGHLTCKNLYNETDNYDLPDTEVYLTHN